MHRRNVILLIVIAIAALTAISYHVFRAKVVPRSSLGPGGVGKQIFLALDDRVHHKEWVYPQPRQYRSSTEYLNTAIQKGWITGVSPSFFSARSLTVSEDHITPQGNIWCITVGLTPASPPNTPCIFTRNIRFAGQSIRNPTAIDHHDLPFDRAVVVFLNGKVMVLDDGNLENFNPSGVDRPFLEP